MMYLAALFLAAVALRAPAANTPHAPHLEQPSAILLSLALAPSVSAALTQRTFLNCGSASQTVMCQEHGLCSCEGVPVDGRPKCDPDFTEPLGCDGACFCRGESPIFSLHVVQSGAVVFIRAAPSLNADSSWHSVSASRR